MAQPLSLNFTVGDDAMFSTRSPQPDTLKVAKLDDGNLRAAGAYIFRTTGLRVEIDHDAVGQVLVVGGLPESRFRPGSWIVEYYFHPRNEVRFRRATTEERETYDLR